MIGILGAMEPEVEFLREKLENPEKKSICGNAYHIGSFFGKQVVISCCGIGKVNAAVCAQRMIDHFSCDILINTGVAGGLATGMHAGDMMVATGAVQHDFDLTPFGRVRGNIFGEDREHPTVFKPDAAWSDRLFQALPDGVGHFRGIVLSGDKFINDNDEREYLKVKYNGSAVEMEGAAIAHAAYLSGVPFAIVRAISDSGDDDALESYETFLNSAAKASAEALYRAIEQA